MQNTPATNTEQKAERRGGARERNGGGWNKWQPQRATVMDDATGAYRQQTLDEAMDSARAIVRHYVSMGYPHETICELMKPRINSPKTLRRHFRQELDFGKAEANARVGATAFSMAVSGRDPSMTRFWLRTQAGWSEGASARNAGAVRIVSIPGDDRL